MGRASSSSGTSKANLMRNRTKITAAAVVLVVSGLVVLAAPACSMLTPAGPTEEAPVYTRTAPTTPAAEPAPTAEPVDPCAGLAKPKLVNTGVANHYRSISELRDTGPRPLANGETILSENGNPAAYIVVAGDTMETIGERFCTDWAYIESINVVRRNGLALYTGDTLNLDAYTITSVGDENGVVYANERPPGSLPPQR